MLAKKVLNVSDFCASQNWVNVFFWYCANLKPLLGDIIISRLKCKFVIVTMHTWPLWSYCCDSLVTLVSFCWVQPTSTRGCRWMDACASVVSRLSALTCPLQWQSTYPSLPLSLSPSFLPPPPRFTRRLEWNWFLRSSDEECLYRVGMVVGYLGWVDLDLGCSTILLGQ